MVAAQTASGTPSSATPPSMGPASIPYVPPITLEEAVVRARMRINERNRRGSRAVIVAVILYALPLVAALSTLFPTDPAIKVTTFDYLSFLATTALFLFLCFATYRITQDRPAVSYPLLGLGAVLVVYEALIIWVLALLFLFWLPTMLVDQMTYLKAMVIPLLSLGAGVMMILGGALALPRRVRASQSA